MFILFQTGIRGKCKVALLTWLKLPLCTLITIMIARRVIEKQFGNLVVKRSCNIFHFPKKHRLVLHGLNKAKLSCQVFLSILRNSRPCHDSSCVTWMKFWRCYNYKLVRTKALQGFCWGWKNTPNYSCVWERVRRRWQGWRQRVAREERMERKTESSSQTSQIFACSCEI